MARRFARYARYYARHRSRDAVSHGFLRLGDCDAPGNGSCGPGNYDDDGNRLGGGGGGGGGVGFGMGMGCMGGGGGSNGDVGGGGASLASFWSEFEAGPLLQHAKATNRLLLVAPW